MGREERGWGAGGDDDMGVKLHGLGCSLSLIHTAKKKLAGSCLKAWD